MDYVSPAVAAAAQSNRTELEMRELIRAKIRARAAYDSVCAANHAGKTEDKLIDLEVRRMAAFKAWEAANLALYDYERKQVSA